MQCPREVTSGSVRSGDNLEPGNGACDGIFERNVANFQSRVDYFCTVAFEIMNSSSSNVCCENR